MSTPELVLLLEEPSAKAMLQGLVPRLLPEGITVTYIVFEGKTDLRRRFERRILGYRNRNARFIILVDQDKADCRTLKEEIAAGCARANRPDAAIRIACHELENWYLADLAAVGRALQIPKLAPLQNKSKYRVPDSVSSAARELKRIAKPYQKVSGSRSIGPHLDIENKRSRSFHHFVSALRQAADELAGQTP